MKGRLRSKDNNKFDIVGGRVEAFNDDKLLKMWIYGKDFTAEQAIISREPSKAGNINILNNSEGVVASHTETSVTFKKAIFTSQEPISFKEGTRTLQTPF